MIWIWEIQGQRGNKSATRNARMRDYSIRKEIGRPRRTSAKAMEIQIASLWNRSTSEDLRSPFEIEAEEWRRTEKSQIGADLPLIRSINRHKESLKDAMKFQRRWQSSQRMRSKQYWKPPKDVENCWTIKPTLQRIKLHSEAFEDPWSACGKMIKVWWRLI